MQLLNWLRFKYLNYRKLLPPKSFVYQGTTYQHYYSYYKRSWETERQIEIPIIKEFIKGIHPADILEIGNILNHYEARNHLVLDLKEEDSDHYIWKANFLGFLSPKKYKRIISISTFDKYRVKELEPRVVIQNLFDTVRKFLELGGKSLVTIPFGYSPLMDSYILSDDCPCDIVRTMAFRKDNWIEVAKPSGLVFPNSCLNAKEVLFCYVDG